MAQASDFTRTDCLVGKKKRRTYETLQREWRCNRCGGGLNKFWSDDQEAHPDHWFVKCAHCGGVDFIHRAEWERRKAEAVEVLDGLPAEFVAALGFAKPHPARREIYSLHPEPVEI